MLMTILVAGLITAHPLSRHALCRGEYVSRSSNQTDCLIVPCTYDTYRIQAPAIEVGTVGWVKEGQACPVAPSLRRHRYTAWFP